VGVKADRNHYDIRECPDRYDPGERVYATEEALTARSLSCNHIVTHHHKTLRHEE
jgi:hypothetical protein